MWTCPKCREENDDDAEVCWSCGTTSGTNSSLLYRSGSIIMWHTTSGTSSWGKIRPSCWLNVISGGGMILAPEGSGGCSCNVWFNTSVGFVKSE